MQKVCFKCKTEKPITSFYVHPQMGDGRLNKCKDCTKRDVANNYRANRDYYREYERQRFNRPERKAQVAQYQTRRRQRFPEKEAARAAVGNAVRDGKIIRPAECQGCGRIGHIEAHHPDYSKPLEVMWLCFRCHRAEHGQDAA